MSESENTHPCPVEGCNATEIAFDRLMCARHWRMVPHTVRNLVYATWREGNPTRSYPVARQGAIDAATKAERN